MIDMEKNQHKSAIISATPRSGFTLIELLTVVAIIGILASIVLVGLGGFRARGRDTRRIADLRQIQNALELYYLRNNTYPDSLNNLTEVSGIDKIPTDPSTNNPYDYVVDSNKQVYVLRALLEGDNSALRDDYDDEDVQNLNLGLTIGCGTGGAGGAENPIEGRYAYCVKF